MMAPTHLCLIMVIVLTNYINSFLVCDKTKPLILTSYIKANRTEEAINLSKVHLDDFEDIVSYSGYFTVNEKFDSNLFFWFFPSENDYSNDPVLLWLQGGPGLPSLYGLFEEHGPFIVKNNTVSTRDYRWSKNHSVLYIDNPVGTGFSYTSGGYATNETQIGEELHKALVQFFTIFKEIKKNDFFLVGESYAGKYVPALAHVIHNKNPTTEVFINLKGLLINNGYVDPINQNDYGEYAYQLGLVDSFVKSLLDQSRDEIIEDIKNHELKSAQWKSIFAFELIRRHSGIASIYNYLAKEDIYYNIQNGDWAIYVEKSEVKRALNVGDNITFTTDRNLVAENLEKDDAVSVAPWLADLLSHYPVLLFSGQLDVIVPYPTTVNFLRKLNFTGVEEYKRAVRFQWKVDGEVAGYCKRGGLLYECLVRNAGHVVPLDQPKYAFDLVYKFVRNITFFADKEIANEIP